MRKLQKRRKWKEEQGEVMIESLLVMIPTLFVMVFLIGLGFLLYQQWNIQYAADEIASKVAGGYTYTDRELSSGTITWDHMKNRALYRYLFLGEEYEAAAERQGKKYGKNLLHHTDFAKPTGAETVTVKTVHDSLARRHVEVTVEGTYKIPFGEGLELFGLSGSRNYKATSVAECVDLLEYNGTIMYTKNFFNLVTDGSSKIVGMLDSWLKVFKTLRHNHD